MKEASVGIHFAFKGYVERVPSPDSMDWAGMFAGRRFAVGMWRRADANGAADGNSRAYANGHQYPHAYTYTGPANIHARAYADAKPHGNVVVPSCDTNATAAGQRSRCT